MTTADPKGGWQNTHQSLTACTRHQNRCAYRQGDPDRCDACHTSWVVIDAWPETTTREQHTAEHARDDAIAAGKATRRAERRTRSTQGSPA